MSNPRERVDWQQIKSAWPADERCIAILDRRAIHLVLSLFHRFSWLATFDHAQAAKDDWDYIQRIVADAEFELGIAMPLSELLPYVDEIEDLLRALQSHGDCCGPVDITNGDQYTDRVTDGVGSVPQNIIDAGYATGTSDWAGFDDYKCMISHVMVQNLENVLRAMAPYWDSTGQIIGGVGTVAAIIGTVLATLATGGIAIILEMIAAVGAGAAVWQFLTGLGDALTEDLADKVATNHDALACAIYYADGTDGAITALKDAIDENFTVAEAAGLKLLNIESSLKALYAGRYDQQDVAQNLADAGYDTGDYDCTCPVEASCDGMITDCSFENAWSSQGDVNSATYGWRQNGDGSLKYSSPDPYEGSVYLDLGSGAGSPNHVYNNFVAPQTLTSGHVYLNRRVAYKQGSYNSMYRLFHWNGSSWSQVGEDRDTNASHGTYDWQNRSELTGWNLIEGDLYSLRIYWGYNYHDNVQLTAV